MRVTYLTISVLDHRPLWFGKEAVPSAPSFMPKPTKRFFFEAFCLKEEGIKEEVEMAWTGDEHGGPVGQFQAKVGRISEALTWWNKNKVGNLFKRIKTTRNELEQLGNLP